MAEETNILNIGDNFDPEHMLRFDVQPRDEETFFIDVERDDNIMQGFFSVMTDNFDDEPSINIFIMDPKGGVAYSKMKKSIGQFDFKTTPG